MSETHFPSKGIDSIIPTPDEVIKKLKDYEEKDKQIDLKSQVAFFKKANDCQIGEKIATLISKQLKDKKNGFLISIDSSYIDIEHALKYIELVVKPMFEEKGWKTYVTRETSNYKISFGIGLWTISWFGDNFVINPYIQRYNCIIIQINI